MMTYMQSSIVKLFDYVCELLGLLLLLLRPLCRLLYCGRLLCFLSLKFG